MGIRLYESPETEIIFIGVMEDVCQNRSGGIPDYNKQSFEWEDEED